MVPSVAGVILVSITFSPRPDKAICHCKSLVEFAKYSVLHNFQGVYLLTHLGMYISRHESVYVYEYVFIHICMYVGRHYTCLSTYIHI